MTVATNLAVLCSNCGKMLAEWDGHGLIVRRPPKVPYIAFHLPAVIQCWRRMETRGQWKECGHTMSINEETITRLTILK